MGEIFLLCNFQGLTEGLHGRFAVAIFPAVRPPVVIFTQVSLQVNLQFLHGGVEFFAEGDVVELLLECAMEAFADTVGLRRTGFSSAVVDVFYSEIKLVGVVLHFAAILRSPICYYGVTGID